MPSPRLLTIIITFSATLLLFFVQLPNRNSRIEIRPFEPIDNHGSSTSVTTGDSPNVTSSSIGIHYLSWTSIASTAGLQLLSAYYDQRSGVPGRPTVVVLGYQLRAHIANTTLYCLLTYSSQTTECRSTPAAKVIIADGNPFLRNKQSEAVEYACHSIPEQSVPVTVALSSSPNCANASERIPVHNQRLVDNRTMHEFAVCVQSPIFRKSSAKIAEFIEMQLALGAQYIIMYLIDVPKKFEQLKQYSGRGQLVMVKWRLMDLHYNGQLLIMQDCLYRNMNRAKYLVYVDLDELILPIQHMNWTSMMKKIDTNPKIGAFLFLNTYFTKNLRPTGLMKPACKELNVPIYFTWTKQYLCKYGRHRRSKFIVKPNTVIELGIHGVSIFRKQHSEVTVPSTIGINAHYRFMRSSDCSNTNTIVDNTVVTRYQSLVIKSLEQLICLSSTSTRHTK